MRTIYEPEGRAKEYSDLTLDPYTSVLMNNNSISLSFKMEH